MENITQEIKNIEDAMSKTNNKREYIRLKAIKLKLSGYTAKSIAEKLDVGRLTIFTWLKAYKENSVEALKNKKRPGNLRNLSIEEEKEFLKQFEEKAQKGQIVTAKEIEKAYRERVGHSIGTGQIYRVLNRNGFRKVMPRSKHPKKAKEEVIETSKKLNPKLKNLETFTHTNK
ncbi:helix-turn-helix domain-containing protein [Lagierella sp.]|uniref:helix-turn-helix domain-containing protein n=1 Tax=Lagierella sp. TaxID=2849657 RepID=UPI0026297D80|nr:helix-turn-helix domain-containing protein [Lagierella sp.]